MSRHRQRIPEPILPEHELIRAAGTLPELSSGLRAATLTGCQAYVLRAQRLRRLKIASSAAVAASVIIAATVMYATSTDGDPQPIVHDTVPPAAAEAETLTQTTSTPSTSTPSTSVQPGAIVTMGNPGGRSEQEMIEETIEDVNRRAQKLMDAGIIPGF